jgi:hypothetical protein
MNDGVVLIAISVNEATIEQILIMSKPAFASFYLPQLRRFDSNMKQSYAVPL